MSSILRKAKRDAARLKSREACGSNNMFLHYLSSWDDVNEKLSARKKAAVIEKANDDWEQVRGKEHV